MKIAKNESHLQIKNEENLQIYSKYIKSGVKNIMKNEEK